MKRLFLPASLAVTLALFAACEESTHRPPPKKGGWHPTEPPNGENPKPEPGEEPEKPAKPAPDEPKVNPVPEPPKQVGEVPYGKPVPGKPGFVFSPSDQFKYIDVRGYPPGTPVTDPYSGKTFLVP